MFTGQYSTENGMWRGPGQQPLGSPGYRGIKRDVMMLSEHLAEAGYQTGAFGKWHNGTQPPYHPNFRGFDEYYGFTSGHWGHYFSPPLDHNGRRVRGSGFIIDDFTDHALEFIEANKEKPFFCYVPFNTPHSPMMVEDRFYQKFEGKDPVLKHRDVDKEDVMMTRAALAMCENIDWNVGRILKKLDELNLRENTIVVWFSDNGPNSFRWNGGMKGKKGSIDEGGLRSPFFIRWPEKIRAGKSIPQIAGAIDLLPTLTELAGIAAKTNKPIDGLSLRPLLTGQTVQWKPRTLLSIRKNQVSVRSQQYRLDATGQLFDIQADRGQRTDVSKQHPELAKQLLRQAKQHAKEMKTHFDAFADRPFTVGFSSSTTLPARDGIEHGTIKRSAKAPNNSFFTNWTSVNDSITWEIEIVNSGKYEAIVYYTCAAGDEGATLQLSMKNGDSVTAQVGEVFDPPLYDKSKERIAESHYYQKDFKPLTLGSIELEKGQGTLTLGALEIKGKRVIDVHSIDLIRR
jgi:arylsulfatase A-like enzyme